MSEEASVINNADAAPQADGQEVTTWENSPIAQVWNPDGTPKEGAQAKLAELGHEGISGFALRNNQGIFDALNNGKEARASLSKRQEAVEGAIIKPGEDASDEDKNAFKVSLGALSTADEYGKVIWPNDLPEGFQKDEELGTFAAEWAAKHPVNTPEAMKELAQGVIALQQKQQATFAETQLIESKKEAETVKAELIAEVGGQQQFDEFSKEIKSYLTGPEAVKMGFEFRVEEGKVITDNPLHAAMLNDRSILRLLGNKAKESNPARLPGQNPAQSPEASKARRQELASKQLNGTLTQDELAELTTLRTR